MCGRANPSLWGFAPVLRQLGTDLGFVPLVIGASAILYVLTLVASGPGLQVMGGGFFNILSPGTRALVMFGASGAVPVFVLGNWWSILSATWLHGGLLHIAFNMMWVRDIGPSTADVIGPARTVIIYVVSGVCGFLLSSVAGMYVPAMPLLRVGALRPQEREQSDSRPGQTVGADHVHLRPGDAGHRQLCTRRRISGWLRDVGGI
jgi:rhomboid protease GluP